MGKQDTKVISTDQPPLNVPQIIVGAPEDSIKVFRHFAKGRRAVFLLIALIAILFAAGAILYKAHIDSNNRANQAAKAQGTKKSSLSSVAGSKEFNSPTVKSDASSADKSANEVYLASVSLNSHDYVGALSHYKKAVALTPDNASLLYTTGDIAIKAKSADAKQYYTLAYKAYVKTVEADPGSPIFKYDNVAELAEKIGDNSAAKNYYQKVLDSATAAAKQNEQLAPVIDHATERLKALS
jgi:type II secretory pathway pseudopilin PulG